MAKARKFVLQRPFQGDPDMKELAIVEEELPPLKDGQVLLEAVFLSVDPYQRGYAYVLKSGDTMPGSQLARVAESRCKDFPAGSHVLGYWGWRDRSVVDPLEAPPGMPAPRLVPDLGDLPLSLALGAAGMPGNTAYFGLLDICNPQPGEVVVVNAAAGAVGSHVGQIAKIKGCKVIGFAGSDEKVRWLEQELGFDAAFNYKRTNVARTLAEVAPAGVDVFFDNVGGEMSSQVIGQMSRRGRISVCGGIATQDDFLKKLPKMPAIQPDMVRRELRMEGFMVFRFLDRWEEGVHKNLEWIREGKIKYRETITQGFENLPRALKGLMNGENIGKSLVRA